MIEIGSSSRRRALVRGVAIVVFWTLVGLAGAAQAHMSSAMEGRPVSGWLSLFRAAPIWWAWIPVTPIVAWLAHRVRFERGSWPRAIGIHFAAAIALAAVLSVFRVGLYLLLGVVGEMADSAEELLRLLFVWRAYLDVVIYWAVLGATYAFDYYARFREGELRASRLETRLARARLDALRMQLNPHFLFNALNAVAAQVRAGRGQTAVTMLGGLGDLLRYTLDSGDAPLVPLWQELAFLERYLDIERVRFGDRLQVVVDAPSSLREARLPPLLLQPLAENAIRHGIAPRDAPGRVEVQARRQDDHLVIAVRDDGVGLAAALDARPAPGGAVPATGVGLANTRERLTELYGDRHTFAIADRSDGGVEVTIRVPWTVDGAQP